VVAGFSFRGWRVLRVVARELASLSGWGFALDFVSDSGSSTAIRSDENEVGGFVLLCLAVR
jgi:hypothetical protein